MGYIILSSYLALTMFTWKKYWVLVLQKVVHMCNYCPLNGNSLFCCNEDVSRFFTDYGVMDKRLWSKRRCKNRRFFFLHFPFRLLQFIYCNSSQQIHIYYTLLMHLFYTTFFFDVLEMRSLLGLLSINEFYIFYSVHFDSFITI